MYAFWPDYLYQDERTPSLALHAVAYDEHGWNGFHVPHVTADEFRRFISAHYANDPNGTYDPNGVSEGDGALVYVDENGKDVWPVVGMSDGVPLYAVSGWTWAEPVENQ